LNKKSSFKVSAKSAILKYFRSIKTGQIGVISFGNNYDEHESANIAQDLTSAKVADG